MNKIIKTYGPDPIALCKEWLAEASASEINDPEAVNLATADARGRPSNRMVLIKDISDEGFKFHTNGNSRKGRELEENPFAALCFYWKSTRKQIRIEGTIRPVEEAEVDEYFAGRSKERQIGAWASAQSETFEDEAHMEGAVARFVKKFTNLDQIPRPPYWKGYRVDPHAIEFWIANEFRLHTRFIYRRNKDGGWTAHWMCP
ncbi:MAG: pyridoxamine 5'-phosphate oxidase [Alphaproteobacteria bacterium]|nr:pyridoxamine 5'-phosphate oxidase [Alphaproteobacteria bacterium]